MNGSGVATLTNSTLSAGTHSITAAYGGGGTNYGGSISGTLSQVVKQTVTVSSGLTANSKTYDGTTTTTISSNSVVLSGVQSGDTANVALSTNSYTATFAGKDAANGIAVTVSGLTLTGTAAGNYIVPGVKRDPIVPIVGLVRMWVSECWGGD